MNVISDSQSPRRISAAQVTGPLTAFAATICKPSGVQEQRLKYVVRGECVKGCEMVCSSTKLFTQSCAVVCGVGEVNLKTRTVRSSLAVAKYLFAGSKVMPLTRE